MRKNGFSRPYERIQILCWLLFLLIVGTFYTVYLPYAPTQFLLTLMIPYSILLFILLYLALKVCVCNPIDNSFAEHSKISHKSLKMCTICQMKVHLASKHCHSCNKCIAGFDHHCKALNNCIGSKNYAHFFWLINTFELFLSLQLSYSFYFLSFYASQDRNWGFIIFVIIEICVEMALFIMNGALVAFHCWLRKKKISTYEYVLGRKACSRSVTPSFEDRPSVADQYVLNSPQPV